MTWSDIAKEYALRAAPIAAPILAVVVCSLLLWLVMANQRTRDYAKMAWSLLEDQLTTTVGEEKGKTVAKKWNDIADELENTKKKGKTPQGAAYSKAYFLTRLQTEAGLSKAQTEAIGRMLSVLDGTQGKDVSATSAEEYNVPKLPCRCLL